MGGHLIVFSKAGSVRGRHYHKGLSLTKNPEILILLSGELSFSWREVMTTEESKEIVKGPARIEIFPYTWHELVAINDCSFLELNSLSEHVADVFY
jgi:dTDP-4-dehydrorhamnose 3,5-epimerase-like enzyme